MGFLGIDHCHGGFSGSTPLKKKHLGPPAHTQKNTTSNRNGKFIPPIKMVMTGGWFMNVYENMIFQTQKPFQVLYPLVI
jgi:hypothetical protein